MTGLESSRLAAETSHPAVTFENEIDEATVARLYALYVTAFEPLRDQAAARQLLDRDEFVEIIADPRVTKVLYRRDDEALGVAALTNELDLVPWISQEYFRALYPEHAARRAIFYLPLAFVDPDQRGEHLLDQLIVAVGERLLTLKAVCGYDICAFNNRSFAFNQRITAALQRVTAIDARVVDTQTFYVVGAA